MRLTIATALLFLALAPLHAGERPRDIVDAAEIVPGLVLDMRYAGPRNFVGRPIPGYLAEKCLLTRRAALALKRVQEELRAKGLGLKVYDCYRPRRAVKAFVAWARDVPDQAMKPDFYPDVDKRALFRKGYISSRSGHSRASTVDLTIVPLDAPSALLAAASGPIRACAATKEERAPDSSIDMGSGFDCFDPLSHTGNPRVGKQVRANRALLKSLMSKHGFGNAPEEWWHYTLRGEPYPGTYFDFPVQ
jgi:D-alanyl-D-alanine dipeptidase